MYSRVPDGMCPIYGYLGVIWVVFAGMCIYGGLYGLLWFSLVIYGLYALYSIFVISLLVSVIFGYMFSLLLPYALYLRLPKVTV